MTSVFLKFLKPLRNRRGAGVMMLAFAASVLIAGGTATVLFLSGQVAKESSRSFANYQGDEYFKNALIYTKTLLDRKCLTEKEGGWTVAATCQSTGEWELKDPKGSLEFDLCISNGAKALEMSKQDLDPTNCTLQTVKVALLEKVSGNRRKVLAQTTVGKLSRTAIALLGSDISIVGPDPDEPDPKCVEGIKSGVINFEEFAAGSALDNQAMLDNYGVTFESLSGGTFKIAGVVEKGEAEPSFEAWASFKCKGKPNHNRLCFDQDPHCAGTKVLSTSEALNSTEIKFRITYKQPVSSLSFMLADVDGGEKWTMKAWDKAGAPISNIQVTGKGYGDDSGNSALRPYGISNPDGLISKVEVHGTKNIKLFGFGFDNFITGLKPCPAPVTAPSTVPTPAPTP